MTSSNKMDVAQRNQRSPLTGILAGALLTTAAHCSKIIVGFLFLKLVAVYLGVEGLGALGNFMSAVLALSLLAGGGILNGIIKYVAEYRHQTVKMLRFLDDARQYSIAFCSAILLLTILFIEPLGEYLLRGKYIWMVVVLGVAQFAFAFSNVINGAANGLRQTRVYAAVQIVGNLITVPVSWYLISNFEFVGAALSIVFFYSSYSLPALYFYMRSRIRKNVRWRRISWGRARDLSGFTLMAVVGAVSVPLVEIVVRNIILDKLGLEAAGLWQGAIKLSSAYMGFFVVFLAAYFIPTVSGVKDRSEIARLVKKFMGLVVSLFLVGATVLYLMRDFFIPLLLSSEFAKLSQFIQYQLIGDFFRIAAYVIGFVVVANAATKLYVVMEISQGILFSTFSAIALHHGWGLQGVFVSHVLMNVIYFTCTVSGFYFYSKRNAVC